MRVHLDLWAPFTLPLACHRSFASSGIASTDGGTGSSLQQRTNGLRPGSTASPVPGTVELGFVPMDIPVALKWIVLRSQLWRARIPKETGHWALPGLAWCRSPRRPVDAPLPVPAIKRPSVTQPNAQPLGPLRQSCVGSWPGTRCASWSARVLGRFGGSIWRVSVILSASVTGPPPAHSEPGRPPAPLPAW
jgi:hypothetical protein